MAQATTLLFSTLPNSAVAHSRFLPFSEEFDILSRLEA